MGIALEATIAFFFRTICVNVLFENVVWSTVRATSVAANTTAVSTTDKNVVLWEACISLIDSSDLSQLPNRVAMFPHITLILRVDIERQGYP